MFYKQKSIQFFARILLGSIFLYSSFSKLAGWEGTIQFMESKGFPLAPLFLVGALLIEVAGALTLYLNYKPRIGSLLLVFYLIPTTLIFHNFWSLDGQQFQQQILHFFKNLSIIGGLLTLIAAKVGTEENR